MSAASTESSQIVTTSKNPQFLEEARQLLHKRLKVRSRFEYGLNRRPNTFVSLKVVVKDGRVLIGDFLCIDKQGNLILGNTYQQIPR